MHLTYFSAKTLPPGNQGCKADRRPRIRFDKTGLITINGHACTAMGLKAGDKIIIAQDVDEPHKWYIFKDEQGFTVRLLHNKKDHGFNHSVFITIFREAMSIVDPKGFSYTIDSKPVVFGNHKTEHWLIITAE